MKNITVSVDDETHRAARVRAAELGTSVSALVKSYLQELAAGAELAASTGVREMPQSFTAAPKQPGGPPWLIDGAWVYTPDGKPRQPGALRFLPPLPEDFNDWTPELEEAFHEVLSKPWNDDDFDPLP